MAIERIEFIDCGSLSINYDETGKATVSLTVVRSDRERLKKSYTNRTWGKVRFNTVLMTASQQPMVGSGGWSQWSLQMEGVGNRVS